jgi:hypothetical protein
VCRPSVFLLMLSCMAFRQQTGIPEWPGEMSLSLDSFDAD